MSDRGDTLQVDPEDIQFPSMDNFGYWSRRYANGGELWGLDPSFCAQWAIDNLPASSTVIDFGCGYGRDVIALLREGHTVYGIDESSIATNMASINIHRLAEEERFENPLHNGKGYLINGDFKHFKLPSNNFNALISHRTLHLANPSRISTIATRMASVLTPGSYAIVSARDPRDFNKEQMELIDARDPLPGEGDQPIPLTAAYKDPERAGHFVNFWDNVRFQDTKSGFARRFNIFSFHQGEEMESVDNPGVTSYFTAAVMVKKTEAEIAVWDQAHNANGNSGSFPSNGGDVHSMPPQPALAAPFR